MIAAGVVDPIGTPCSRSRRPSALVLIQCGQPLEPGPGTQFVPPVVAGFAAVVVVDDDGRVIRVAAEHERCHDVTGSYAATNSSSVIRTYPPGTATTQSPS